MFTSITSTISPFLGVFYCFKKFFFTCFLFPHPLPLIKVDVFAYGMVLYELLSHRSPFAYVHPPLKRNNEVKDGKRPNLDVKETRSPLLLQELMNVCWEHDPTNRPRMEQVVEWILAPEFERLRAEVSLNEIKSISCACVCRISPEHEESGLMKNTNASGEESKPVCNGMTEGYRSQENGLDRVGSLGSLIDQYGGNDEDCGVSGGIDLIIQNMLPTVSLESVCIENSLGEKFNNLDEDIYQFLPSRHASGGRVSHPGSRKKRRLTETRQRKISKREPKGETNTSPAKFDPYTQIWMCGRDQRKGLLQIFTFNDNHCGYYVSHCYIVYVSVML